MSENVDRRRRGWIAAAAGFLASVAIGPAVAQGTISDQTPNPPGPPVIPPGGAGRSAMPTVDGPPRKGPLSSVKPSKGRRKKPRPPKKRHAPGNPGE